jgi:hypothetical protein
VAKTPDTPSFAGHTVASCAQDDIAMARACEHAAHLNQAPHRDVIAPSTSQLHAHAARNSDVDTPVVGTRGESDVVWNRNSAQQQKPNAFLSHLLSDSAMNASHTSRFGPGPPVNTCPIQNAKVLLIKDTDAG